MAKKIATSIDMLGNKITGLPTATQPSDAVRFDQLGSIVLAEAEVLLPEIVVRAVSAANLATLVGPQTVDGLALVAGDYALLKNQTTTSQNGVWKVGAAGVSWSRATGYDSDSEIRQREVMCSGDGTVNKVGYCFTCSNTAAITVGTTALTYVQVPNGIGTGALNAAAGNHSHTGLPTGAGEVNASYISVSAVSQGNLTLSAPQTVDGVSLTAGLLCLVRMQSDARQNGVYTVNAGAWTRPTGYDSDDEMRKRIVMVGTDGTVVKKGATYQCSTAAYITIGTTYIGIAALPLAASNMSLKLGSGLVITDQTDVLAAGLHLHGRPTSAEVEAQDASGANMPLYLRGSEVRSYGDFYVDGAAKFTANPGTYGSLAVVAAKGGYHGISLPGVNLLALISSTTGGDCGLLNETAGRWLILDQAARRYLNHGTLIELDTPKVEIKHTLQIGGANMYSDDANIIRMRSANNTRGIEFYNDNYVAYSTIYSYDRVSSAYNSLRLGGAIVEPDRAGAIYLGSTNSRWSTIYTTTAVDVGSDRRIKHDVENVPLGLDFLNDLRPVQYKLNQNGVKEVPLEDGEVSELGMSHKSVPTVGERFHFGLIAQELKEVLDKHGVDAGVWCTDDKGDPEALQSIRYEELISPMIKAMQEMSQQLAALAKRVEALEAQRMS